MPSLSERREERAERLYRESRERVLRAVLRTWVPKGHKHETPHQRYWSGSERKS